MPDLILALNAGSSSIKHGLFALTGSDSPVEVDRGETDDDGNMQSLDSGWRFRGCNSQQRNGDHGEHQFERYCQ